MKFILLTIVALTLCSCDQIHEYTKSYPIDKNFKYRTHSFTLDDKNHSLNLLVKLSYKSDKKGYYNIEITGDLETLLKRNRVYLRFLDKNNMILYEMSPGWSTNDAVNKINQGISRRGTFSINEGVFKEFNDYEVFFRNK